MAHVLAVEDDPDIRLLLEQLGVLAGFGVTCVEGGRPALAWLEAGNHADIVVLDVRMPGFDGWETLRELRARWGESFPVVMCTVEATRENMVRGWRLGCDAYITKPFTTDTFMGELRRLIDQPVDARLSQRNRELAAAIERERLAVPFR